VSANLTEYLEEVAAENARQSIANPSDRRLAVNAIMTLDGFFGSLHADLRSNGLVEDERDDTWKESIAIANKMYRVLRDSAYALKHGQLTGSKPRLVRRHNQILTMPAAFDAGFYPGAFHTEVVWIEAEDTDYRADEVIARVLEIAREELSQIK
jgi:hypothetical protein